MWNKLYNALVFAVHCLINIKRILVSFRYYMKYDESKVKKQIDKYSQDFHWDMIILSFLYPDH